MADVAIAITDLVANAPSADVLTAAAQIKSVTSSDTGVVAVNGDTAKVVFSLYNASGGATVTFAAGDNPPSHRAGLGSDACAVGSGETVLYVVEGGRFVQDDGTVTFTTTGTVIVGAFRIPQTV